MRRHLTAAALLALLSCTGDFRVFIARIRRDLPRVPIAWISIKPSLARAAQLDARREANAPVKKAASEMRDVEFIDVSSAMLDANGQPRPERFADDGLHMNERGYTLWQEIIAPYLAEDWHFAIGASTWHVYTGRALRREFLRRMTRRGLHA